MMQYVQFRLGLISDDFILSLAEFKLNNKNSISILPCITSDCGTVTCYTCLSRLSVISPTVNTYGTTYCPLSANYILYASVVSLISSSRADCSYVHYIQLSRLNLSCIKNMPLSSQTVICINLLLLHLTTRTLQP